MSAAMLRIMYTVWTAVVLYAVRTSGDHAGDLYSGVWPIVSVARLERPLVERGPALCVARIAGGPARPKVQGISYGIPKIQYFRMGS